MYTYPRTPKTTQLALMHARAVALQPVLCAQQPQQLTDLLQHNPPDTPSLQQHAPQLDALLHLIAGTAPIASTFYTDGQRTATHCNTLQHAATQLQHNRLAATTLQENVVRDAYEGHPPPCVTPSGHRSSNRVLPMLQGIEGMEGGGGVGYPPVDSDCESEEVSKRVLGWEGGKGLQRRADDRAAARERLWISSPSPVLGGNRNGDGCGCGCGCESVCVCVCLCLCLCVCVCVPRWCV